MNVQALLRNKKVLYGGAGVAAVAGFALYKRHQAAGGGGNPTTDTAAGGAATPGAYVPGSFPDTSGTDMAGYLGQFGGNLQTQLDDFLAQLAQAQDGTAQIPTSGTTGTGTTSPTGPISVPVPRGPAPAPGGRTPKTVKVVKYTSRHPAWNSTLSGIAAREHTTVAALQKLNGIKGTTIHPGQVIKIPT